MNENGIPKPLSYPYFLFQVKIWTIGANAMIDFDATLFTLKPKNFPS